MASVKHEQKNEAGSGPKSGGISDQNRNSGGRPGGPGQKFTNAGPHMNKFGPNRNEERNFQSRGFNQNSQGQNVGGKGGGGGRGKGGPPGERFIDDRIREKLMTIGGPTLDLPPHQGEAKKFLGNCRMYVGNFASNFTEEELVELFKPYGEVSEPFYSKEKNFGFIKMDYRSNAEKAKNELDGKMHKGKPLKVRFAPPGTIIKVKNLSDQVSNELLEMAFSVFGEVDRAVIISDERGNSTHEGIVEFARKPGALTALRKCQEGCFFLTSDLRPVIVEICEPLDDTDGLPDKNLNRKSADFFKAREIGPRFAKPGSFEYEYGTRWKSLYELYQQKVEALKREMKIEEEKLEAQMEYARYEHETEILREQLRQREQDRERQKLEWEMKQRQVDELRRQEEELMRRQSEDLSLRMLNQDDEIRRRQQDNTLFMQAHQLNNMLDQQEPTSRLSKSFAEPSNVDPLGRDYDIHGGGASLTAQDSKTFMEPYDSRGGNAANRFDNNQSRSEPPRGGNSGNAGGAVGGNGGGRWAPAVDRRPATAADDFQNKRRRY